MAIRIVNFAGTAAVGGLLAALFFCAAPAFAQAAAPAARDTAVTAPAHDVRASHLIGSAVRSPQGKALGDIDDLIIDVGAQRVHYAVLSFSSANGADGGGKLFAFPIHLFRPGASDEHLVLNVSQDKLRAAPGFLRSAPGTWDNGRYASQVERYFATGAIEAVPPGERFRSARGLIDKDVRTRSGEAVGEIEDLVVNMGDARVVYAVLEFDRDGAAQDLLLPLPLTAFVFPPRRDADLVLALPRERLALRRGFAEDRWPDLNDPAYRRELDAYLADFGAGAASSQGGDSSGAAGR